MSTNLRKYLTYFSNWNFGDLIFLAFVIEQRRLMLSSLPINSSNICQNIPWRFKNTASDKHLSLPNFIEIVRRVTVGLEQVCVSGVASSRVKASRDQRKLFWFLIKIISMMLGLDQLCEANFVFISRHVYNNSRLLLSKSPVQKPQIYF